MSNELTRGAVEDSSRLPDSETTYLYSKKTSPRTVDLLLPLTSSLCLSPIQHDVHDRTRQDTTLVRRFIFIQCQTTVLYMIYIYLPNPSYAWDYMNTKSPPSIPELICRLLFCGLVVIGSLSPSLSLQQREGDRWPDYKTCIKYLNTHVLRHCRL